ncbi:MAG: hypothetical protein JXB05_32800 [Myxococcaceae bacterium]|nr:hypothetical protein [Myxococcaceae bacterium]
MSSNVLNSQVWVSMDGAPETLEACCRGASDEEPIVSALQALENSRRPVRKHQKVPPPTRFLELLAGVLDVAHYEDTDDWPDAVVAGAIELLGELGTPEAQAVQAVADVLARHGVI